MSRIVYADTSALAKLLADEEEPLALTAWIAGVEDLKAMLTQREFRPDVGIRRRRRNNERHHPRTTNPYVHAH